MSSSVVPQVTEETTKSLEGRTGRRSNIPKSITTQADTKGSPVPLSPHQPLRPSNLSHTQLMETNTETMKSFPLPEMRENEYIVPISLPLRVYDQYMDIIDTNRVHQNAVMHYRSPGHHDLHQVRKMLLDLDSVVTHPDLLDETALKTEADLNFGGERIWAINMSQKFGLLLELLERLKIRTNNANKPLHIAIVVAKGQTLDILQGCLDTIPKAATSNVASSFRSTNEHPDSEINGQVHSQIDMGGPTGEINAEKPHAKPKRKSANEKVKPPHTKFSYTVMTNDGTVYSPHQEPSNLQISVIISDYNGSGLSDVDVDLVYILDSSYQRSSALGNSFYASTAKKPRILYPWIFGSPEHVRACTPRVEDELGRLRTNSITLQQLSPEIGDMTEHTEFSSVPTALTDWIVNGYQAEFPIKPMKQIQLVALALTFKFTKKRSRDVSDESESSSSSKRARTSDGQNDDQHDSQHNGEGEPSDITSRKQINVLRSHVAGLRSKLEVKEKEIGDWKLRLEDSVIKHKQSEATADALMRYCDNFRKKFEQEKIANLRILAEKNELSKKLADKEVILQNRQDTINEQAEKIRQLEATLQAHVNPFQPTSIDNASSSDGFSSAGYALQMQLSQQAHEKELASLKRKAQSAENDRAYAFDSYRQASQAAAEYATENAALEAEVKRLRPLAARSAAQVHMEIDRSELITTQEALARVEAEKEELEEQIRRGSGRGMNTRGQSSAPRVIGSPPGRSRASSRQPVSRPGSPSVRGSQPLRRALSGRDQ